MKTKNYYIIWTLVIFAGLSLNSCQKAFLDVPPKGSLNIEVLANKKGVEALLIGAYSALSGQGDDGNSGDIINLNNGSGWTVSPSDWIYGSECGGDAQDMDESQFIGNNPTTDDFNDVWVSRYEGISRCNAVLRVLKEVKDMTNDEKANVAGQARFLRGWYYLDLKKMFNMIPWIDEDAKDVNTPNDKDIWTDIEADFKFAIDSLPTTQSQIGRVNKWAAVCYLAKAYLYEHKYDSAKTLFEDAINNGVTTSGKKYDLTALFEDNFKAATEDNPEAVFSVEMDANDGSGGISHANGDLALNYPEEGPFPCCGSFSPSIDVANSYRTNPITGLPYLNSYNEQALKNDIGVSSDDPFTPDQGTLDPRLDWTIGRRGIPYKDWGIHPGAAWVHHPGETGPYSPKKMLYWHATMDDYYDGTSWAPGTAINQEVMRFADVLLMAAECEAQTGNLDQAEAYVNRVRNRAANPAGWVHTYTDAGNPMGGFTDIPAANYYIKSYPVGDFVSNGKDFALDAIRFERKLELAMEGKRFFDLVRWGIAAETLNTYFAYENTVITYLLNAHFVKNKNEYFPIPQRQIDLTTVNGKPTLNQNPGYH